MVEVMTTGRRIIVTGEITTTVRPQLRASACAALRRAGYTPNRFLICVWVRRQSGRHRRRRFHLSRG
ncbi:hypothetical protein [Corynebacterium auriscanis]|uniref:hypothetical protein n=1 Tax=Corynebacterium auriscanis TaxID=99807 RepID=UPI002245FB40|nr:hypothetical protein [Corynebacterium auriscanis]MCX2164046.1 hypothetical protein [Corynebacterium auriscanis]